jgi:5-methylcytosine-specific restriction endonuclease McrA
MGATSSWRAPPGWRKIREAVFAAKGRSCHWCGRYANTVDHWPVPAALGGPATLANLVPCCQPCNSSRGASFGNRIGGPRGNRRRGPRRPAAKSARVPARTVPAPLRTSRNW